MKCKLKKTNGVTCIEIDGTEHIPVSFKSFRPTKRNITDFYNAGIRLFNILTSGITSAVGVPYTLFGESWIDDEVYDFSVIDKQIDLFIEHAPNAYFSLMIQLDTRDWWLKKYADYPNSFWNLAQMEADPFWREMAAKYMQAVIKHVEEKYKNRFYGYFLLCGTTTEWFSERSYEEPTPLVENEFKKWCGDDDICIPEKELREKNRETVFLDITDDADLIQYRKFQNWQRTDTILYFAKKAQEIIKHERLLGVYFGYIFELESSRLWNTAHLDYERIFTSEDIDMISSPMSYWSRAQDCGSHQMITSGTLHIHDKLYFLEHDQTTCILPDYIEGHRFVHQNKAKTIEEDVNLLRRDFMLAASNGCAMWWFDMFEGWFYHEDFMREITNMITISKTLFSRKMRSVSEIAVIVDPDSMYYVNKNSLLNEMLLNNQRTELAYIGAPYEMFSSCDVDRIDVNQYKLYIFLDQLKKKRQIDRFVEILREKEKVLLFAYGYNILDREYDITCMSNDIGFSLQENPSLEDEIVLSNKESIIGAKVHVPTRCFAVAEDISALGYYKNSKKVALGYKKEGKAIIGFSGLGSMSASAIREFMNLAHVHQYTTNSDTIVYVNNVVLGVYHREKIDAQISLAEDGTYVDVFNDNKEYCSQNKVLCVPYEGCRAKLLVKVA